MDNDMSRLHLDQQLCFSLYAATHAITRIYRPMLVEFGLTYPQYIVMLALLERGESNVNGIAAALKLDAATVTPLLKRIEEAGWIVRTRSRTDERVVLVNLTPQGLALGPKLAAIQTRVRCRTGLGDKAFDALCRTLDNLRITLSTASGEDAAELAG